MPSRNPILVPELRDFLAAKDAASLQALCASGHPGFVAELIAALEPAEAWDVLSYTTPSLRVEIFSHLEEDTQIAIIDGLRRPQVAKLLTDMAPDDRADLLRHMPEEKCEDLLPALAQAEREDIRRLTSYPEGSTGAFMTSDYATLTADLTAAQAVQRLREVAPDKETIYYAYVVDSERHLRGFVSLKDLIVAAGATLVKDLMHTETISARATDDQEETAKKIRQYDLLALPVLDEHDVLVGIVTHDDAVDILVQEQQEDLEKLMAIGGEHQAGEYLRTPAWEHFRRRVGWVVILGILGLFSGLIVQNFEGLLLQFAVLAAFMPMLADTGGNTGSQSATLVVRALALGEVKNRDVARVLAKEFQVAVMLALVLSAVAFGRVLLLGGASTRPDGISLQWIATVVSLALGLQVVSSTLIGAILPLLAAKLKMDPAVVASPALTTVVDISGLLLFFGTAKLLLAG